MPPHTSGNQDADPTPTASAARPTESTSMAQIFETTKSSISGLLELFDALGKQDMGGESSLSIQIASIREDIECQDKTSEAQVVEQQELLKKEIEAEVIDHLTKLIEKGVLAEVDRMVTEQVSRHLEEYAPKQLRTELERHRAELTKLEWELHNSESRRANSTLDYRTPHQALHTIFNAKGEVSEGFPRTLNDMFELAQENVTALMRHYDLGDPSTSRVQNINRLLKHCGIWQCHLVKTGAGTTVQSSGALA